MLRVAKRRASSEEPQFSDFFEVEFCRAGTPDLTPSMYAVGDETVRMHAEHPARSGMGRPRHCTHMDVSALLTQAPKPEPDNDAFQFTNTAHHVLEFATVTELTEFADLVYRQQPRRVAVELEDVRRYIADKLERQDPEWITFCANNTEWQKWAKKK